MPTPLEICLLLVEDNPDDAELILEFLSELHGLRVQVDSAERLSHALELLAVKRYDIALLDLSLPDARGLDALARFRREYPAMPVLILTGLSDEEMAAEAARSGAHAYLVKGRVDPELLGRMIRYAIERARAQNELREDRDQLEELVLQRTRDLVAKNALLLREVEQRAAAEANLRKLAAAVQSAADAILVTDVAGTIEYVNPAFEAMTGYCGAEVIGQNPRMLKSGQNDPGIYRAMYNTIAAGQPWHGQFINRRKDGKLITCDTTISNVCDTEGRVRNYISVSRDVTEEILLRERLNRSQRLEAVGQLAGGIAHDFNNILQAILGYAVLNIDESSADSSSRKNNQEICVAVQRASELTQQLLAFSRKQVLKREPLDFNNVVTATASMLRRVLREDISLELIPGHNLGAVEADLGQMQQVLMNLCVNARDAMPGGGRIMIETENVLVEQDYVLVNTWARAGRFIRLSVTDDGTGMKPEVLDKIFEPFFTTKDEGNGTGLGLATVYGIVQQHDGLIHCYSEEGKGTTFRIYLPMSTRTVATAQTKINGPSRGGTEQILVVEDDPALRALVERILARAGYQVHLCVDGTEALEYFDSGARVDMIVSDVVMPNMGGVELFERLREHPKRPPFLLASGYSARVIEPELLEVPGVALISKPYSPSDFLRQVRALLDAR